mgnify:CR=1 FL=1
MSNKIDVDLIKDEKGRVFAHIKVVDPELLGHGAKFRLMAKVEVSDNRPVNQNKTLFEKSLSRNLTTEQLIKIPASKLNIFSYSGDKIDISVSTQVVVNDGIIFDTKVNEDQQMVLGGKPRVRTNASEMIDPSDRFDFFANLKAIPSRNQMITLILLVVGLVIVGVNMLLGAIDQFSSPGATIFYDHIAADGDSESPFLKALAGSSAVAGGIWLLIKGQLRKYMRFRFARVPAQIKRGKDYKISELVNGKSRVDLHNVKVRIVACNMEKGQYKRGHGTNERTVSFEEPIRAVMLYEKHLPKVAARVPINTYLNENIRFDPMFSVLYPPFVISSSHGLDVHWEVQLVHPKFIDQELAGTKKCFAYRDFLES